MNEGYVEIEIEDDLVNQPQDRKVHGVQVTVMLSAFDIPEKAIRTFDENSGMLKIEFIYSDQEDKRDAQKAVENFLTLEIGKKTKRLQSIAIDTIGLSNEANCDSDLNCTLETAKHVLEAFPLEHPKSRAQSFQAATNILKSYSEKLVPQTIQQTALSKTN